MAYKTIEKIWNPEVSYEKFVSRAAFPSAVGILGTGVIKHPTDSRYDAFTKEVRLSNIQIARAFRDILAGLSSLNTSQTHFANSIIRSEGKPPVLTPTLIGWRVAPKVPNFTQLCNSGIIVVQNLDVARVILTPGTGKTVDVISDPINSYQHFVPDTSWIVNQMVVNGLMHRFKDRSNLVRYWLAGAGGHVVCNYGFDTYYNNVTFVHSVSEVPTGASETIVKFIRDQHQDMDKVLVTECTADANDHEFDILTELAEMPETVRSILNSFKALANICDGLRKKEITISNSYIQFEKRNSKRLYKEYLNRRNSRYKIDSYDVWRRKNLHRIRQETQIEISDALTSIRLTASYTINPLVYSIQDAASAIKRFESVYRTTRKRAISQASLPDINGMKFVGKCEVTRRCWIKRSYVLPDSMSKLAAILSADVLVTAYDKIPIWSIIGDWFFTIGPFLKAIPWNPRYDQNKSTYSTKIEIKGKYINPLDPNVFFEVEGNSYTRDIINPTDHIGIYYNNEFDAKKAQDLAAFIWLKFRGLSIATKEKV